MKIFRSIIGLLLIFAMVFSFVPAFTSKTQAAIQPKLELHAFYSAQQAFTVQSQKYIDALDSISFAWGRLYGDLLDKVNTAYGENGNTMFYYPKDYIDVLKYAKSKNKSIQMNIFSDSVNAAKFLPYKDQRDKAIKAIVDLISKDVSNGEQIYFDGIVIDIEGLQNKDLKGNLVFINGQTIGGWYTQFLKELKNELNKNNKKMYVAVNPMLNFTGYNYKEIAATADKMIVMAHDYEPVTKLNQAQVSQYTGFNSINPIDSLAPINKIKLAMEDIKKNVNISDLKKVMLQLNFDAAQWRFAIPIGSSWNKLSNLVVSLETRNTPTYQMINDRIQNKDGKGVGISYGYNNELQSPFIQYFNLSDKTQNILLYENSKSLKAKIDLVKQFGLGGISLWSLANVPDYADTKSKTYGLDAWDSIINSIAIRSTIVIETKVTITDKVVETAIRKKINKLTGTIYKSDMDKVYRLAVPVGFKTLNDLKQLTNLEYLDLNGTNTTNISVLGLLKNLRVLYLQRNSITDLSALKGLTKLEVLSINGNKVSNIGVVATMPYLTELYIRDNRVSDYSPIAYLKKLNVLYLKGNRSSNYIKLVTIKKSLLECDF